MEFALITVTLMSDISNLNIKMRHSVIGVAGAGYGKYGATQYEGAKR